MPAIDYKATLDHALEELTDLMAEREGLDVKREEMDRRIQKLRSAVIGLGTLCGYDAAKASPELFPEWTMPDVGLTDAIRDVLKAHSSAYLSPVFIRERLTEGGFDVASHKNILASIHTILKRLVKQGQATILSHEGRVTYRWVEKEVDPDDIPF